MIFAFTNQKGGVGKTTCAINLGSYLVKKGFSVLLVDFDPQGNLTSGVGVTKINNSIYDLLISPETTDPKTVLHTSKQDGLLILPTTSNLSGATVELVNEKERSFFLKKALTFFKNTFDFIFIDCPPSLGILTINAFCACDQVFIPLQCEYFAMEGVAQLVKNISLIKKKVNFNLEIFGIILTMYDTRTKLSQDVAKEVTAVFRKKVFNTIIPRNIRIAEAPSYGIPVSIYDTQCIGAKSYDKLSDEVIERWQKTKKD